MFHIIYRITHIESGKVYIGAHSTDNLNDGYMGSGALIERAIDRYGLIAFRREILHVYDNIDDMDKKEAELVNWNWLMDTNTYNLRVGGNALLEWKKKNPQKVRDQCREAQRKGNLAKLENWKNNPGERKIC